MVRHLTDIRRCEAGTLCGFTPSVLQYSTTSSKTASSVQMVLDGVQKLNDNIKLVNANFSIDLESCMTGQVESLHSTHHHKHEPGAHVIDYARGFGNTVKEGLRKGQLYGPLIILPTRSPTILCHPIQLGFETSHFCHPCQLFK